MINEKDQEFNLQRQQLIHLLKVINRLKLEKLMN